MRDQRNWTVLGFGGLEAYARRILFEISGSAKFCQPISGAWGTSFPCLLLPHGKWDVRSRLKLQSLSWHRPWSRWIWALLSSERASSHRHCWPYIEAKLLSVSLSSNPYCLADSTTVILQKIESSFISIRRLKILKSDFIWCPYAKNSRLETVRTGLPITLYILDEISVAMASNSTIQRWLFCAFACENTYCGAARPRRAKLLPSEALGFAVDSVLAGKRLWNSWLWSSQLVQVFPMAVQEVPERQVSRPHQ